MSGGGSVRTVGLVEVRHDTDAGLVLLRISRADSGQVLVLSLTPAEADRIGRTLTRGDGEREDV